MGFVVPLVGAISTAFSAVGAGAATAGQAALALGTVATGVSAVGAGVSAYSSYRQAQYQSQVASMNAKISAQNAQSSLEEGAAQASIERTNTGRRIAGALAAQGANGVDTSFGSPAELRGALLNEGNLDAATISYNASRRALGFATQSAGYVADAANYKATAGNSIVSGIVGVGSTLLSGASSLSGKVATGQLSGALPSPKSSAGSWDLGL